MRSALAALFVASTFLVVTPLVSAQVVDAHYPIEVVPAPSVVVPAPRVVVEWPYIVRRPLVTYSPLVESAMVTAYRPRVVVGPTCFAPRTVYRVHTPPVVTYRPMVTTYRPIVTTYRPVGPVVVYSHSVVVRPKVYVVGQPLRNVLRAITP